MNSLGLARPMELELVVELEQLEWPMGLVQQWQLELELELARLRGM